jgi:amino acid adenylation domain-containing protein
MDVLVKRQNIDFGERRELRVDFPQGRCIHELVAAQAERCPDAIAVTTGSQHLTYHELNCRTNQLAHRLRAVGIGPEVIVAICVERSVEMIFGLLAILKAGGAYVPLDPVYPQQQLAFMLTDSQASVLLTQEHLLDKLAGHAALTICLDCEWRTFADESPSSLLSEATTDNLAYTIYTSGSTGQPKGVAITHRSLLNLIYWHQRAFSVTAADRATQVASPAFDASVWEIWPYLSAGASLHIADKETRTLPSRLRDWLTEEQITLSFLPTPLAEALLSPDWPADLALRCLLTGGDRLHNYPPAGLPFELVNNYGPTEGTVVATSGRVPAREKAGALPPIGWPIANTQAYLLDRDLQPVPDGTSGELFIGGIGLARGYLGRPALTAERFIPHPFSCEVGARLYRTGDLARYHADGTLEFLGRVDRQVKVRGFRIELDGIETVLASHPAVHEAVVLAWDVARGSNGGRSEMDKCLAAYLVPCEGITPSIGELRAYLEEQLPAYMLPSTFTLLETMPLTPNGKIDRRALPPPEWEKAEPGTTYVPPRTPLEEMLAEIWAEVLRVERPGVHDNFFDLGGHSLLAAQIVTRLHRLFRHDFSIHILFEAPTLAALADRVEAANCAEPGQELPPIEPVAGPGPYPLSFTQQQLWLIDQIDPGNLAYNIPFLLRLSGTLDVAVLRHSLSEIVHRHQALRATFATQDDQPVQAIAPVLDLPFTEANLRHLPEEEREAMAQRLAVEAARQPFDLARGPLLRILLLQLAETEHLLLLTMHHIISDGWSMGVLLTELAALYPAFANGQPSPLAPLAIQYTDFAAWQRTWLHSEMLDARLAYWRQCLDGAPPLLTLPTDRLRPPVQTFHGAHQPLTLPQPLIAALAALARQEEATLFMALLAAFKALLYHYTGQTDIVVGSPVANRNRVEIEPLIGYFVNTVALRTSLAGDPTFRELLARVRDTALSAYTHQDLPFATLVERLRPERDTGHNPIFQVMLTLQTAPMDLPTLPGLDLSLVNIDIGAAQFD